MLDIIQSAIQQSGKSCFPTLLKLSQDDVIDIWGNVSGFVERQMLVQKGVYIPGLGTFSFSRQKLDVGNNKFTLIQRPVFLVCEKFALIHGLKHTRPYTEGNIPIVQLNFVALSLETPFDRDTVEGCVRETLQVLSRSVALKKNAEFSFRGIGLLSINNGKVKMKFFKDFLNLMDGSGDLIKALSNRPGTCDSVISNRESLMSQCGTSNTVRLPRLDNKIMQSITEEAETVEEEEQEQTTQWLENQESNNEEKNEDKHIEAGEMNRDIASARLLSPRKYITPATVTAVNLTDDLVINKRLKTAPERLMSPAPPQLPKSDKESSTNHVKWNKTPPASECPDHCRAGQELCYLCMQRAQRNIPVYLAQEKWKKELEEDRILQQFQHVRDLEAMQKKQEDMQAAREHSQKVAAFNLGVAEAIRAGKNARPSEFYTSYIFQRRPLTPSRFPKQEIYARSLAMQVDEKKERESRWKQDKEFLDRLELMQLTRDIAFQRERYQREKAGQMQTYKNALDAQMRAKPPYLPPFEPDSVGPIFGKYDMSNEKLAENRKRAVEAFKHQLQAAADRRKNAILHQLTEQKKEQEMLDQCKNDMLLDQTTRFEKQQKIQSELEEDWDQSIQKKQQKQHDEDLFHKAGSHLLLDQCEKYKRCMQCKRTTSNCGESNIWSDSRYIPGSRLMV
ncbi:coiled-coil domain-containing protein 81 [Protopterus annectens]|uniref:coiled-coil domain-containing protein 81 n=1 Tax=Protopterus annectens TaxID=7888 RepID=UPI001CFB2065|nr:coiled-coil domain-containing protein 81 [Protopterus annectens]